MGKEELGSVSLKCHLPSLHRCRAVRGRERVRELVHAAWVSVYLVIAPCAVGGGLALVPCLAGQ